MGKQNKQVMEMEKLEGENGGKMSSMSNEDTAMENNL